MTYRPILPDATHEFEIPTYADLVEHAMDHYGMEWDGDSRTLRRLKRAVRTALNEVANAKEWRFFQRHWAFSASAPVTDTVTYTNSTRVLVLDTESTPSWINQASLMITGGNYEGEYEIERVDESGNILLRADNNPGADLSGQDAEIIRRRYPLPFDCLKVVNVFDVDNNRPLINLTLAGENTTTDSFRNESSQPIGYFVARGGSASTPSLVFSPPPDTATSYRVEYKAGFQDMRVLELETTATFTSGQLTATLASGRGDLAGCVIRLSDTTGTGSAPEDYPSCQIGGVDVDNPWDDQRIIVSQSSDTAIVVDQAFSSSATNAYVTISSAVDCMVPIMLNYIHASILYHAGRMMRAEDERKITEKEVMREKVLAFEADDSGSYGAGHTAFGLRRQNYLQYSGAGNMD